MESTFSSGLINPTALGTIFSPVLLYIAKEVIPKFDGDLDELEPFLEIVKLMCDTLDRDDQKKLISYVYNGKLSKSVRRSISFPEKPRFFYELQERLSVRYKRFSPRCLNLILRHEMSNLSPHGMGILEYRNRLLNLNDEIIYEELKFCEDRQVKKAIIEANAKNVLMNFKRGFSQVDLEKSFGSGFLLANSLDEAVAAIVEAKFNKLKETGDHIMGSMDNNLPDENDLLLSESLKRKVKCTTQAYLSDESLEEERESEQEKQMIVRSSLSNNFGLAENIHISLICKNACRYRIPLKFSVCENSSISLIKKNKVNPKTIRRSHGTFEMASKAKVQTIGSSILVFKLKPGAKIRFNFHVIDSTYAMESDGLIGSDFLKHFQVQIDNENAAIILKHNKQKYELNTNSM